MNWVSLALSVLKLVAWVFDYYRERGLIQRGTDEEIARQSAKIWSMTAEAKRTQENVNALSDEQLDDLLRRLEQSDPSGVREPTGPAAGRYQ